jgi:hypothetical protein
VGGGLILDRVADAPKPLDHAQAGAMKRAVVGEPRLVGEVGCVDDERVALEASDGVAQIAR